MTPADALALARDMRALGVSDFTFDGSVVVVKFGPSPDAPPPRRQPPQAPKDAVDHALTGIAYDPDEVEGDHP